MYDQKWCSILHTLPSISSQPRYWFSPPPLLPLDLGYRRPCLLGANRRFEAPQFEIVNPNRPDRLAVPPAQGHSTPALGGQRNDYRTCRRARPNRAIETRLD